MSNFIPNSFQVPNAIIDEMLPQMTPKAAICYFVVIRQTKGWNKEQDFISISQFMKKTGLSNRSVINAVNELVELGLIEKKQVKQGNGVANMYSVNLCKNFTSEKNSPVKNLQNTCEYSSLPPVKNIHTQKNTITKNTIQKTSVCNAHTPDVKNSPENSSLPAEKPKVKKSTSKDKQLALLEQHGITGQVALDYLAVRASKGKPLTQTALNHIKRKADEVGITTAEAIKFCADRCWIGFNPQWYYREISDTQQGFGNNQSRPKMQTSFSHEVYGETVMPDWMED